LCKVIRADDNEALLLAVLFRELAFKESVSFFLGFCSIDAGFG
jgi:hypothetical protein